MKAALYINGEKVDDAELLDVRYDRAKTQDRTALTAMFDGNVVCAGSMQRLMSNKAFERLRKRLIGRTGPGTRLKKARKWHMNRAERRTIAFYTAEHLRDRAILAGRLEGLTVGPADP